MFCRERSHTGHHLHIVSARFKWVYRAGGACGQHSIGYATTGEKDEDQKETVTIELLVMKWENYKNT